MFLQLACMLLLQTPVQTAPVQALPFPINTPRNGYAIRGQLVFENNVQPVTLEVTLEVDDGRTFQRTMSGPSGDFRFERLPYGRFFVVIEGERFWSVRESVTIDQGAFDDVRVSIPLKSRPRMGGAAGDTVSVRNLRRTPPPRDAQKEFEKGIEEQRKGQSRKAIEHFQKAVRIAPGYYEANLQLGFEQHRAGNRSEAVRCFEAALEIDPDSISSRNALGKIYFENQEYRKAADVLVELMKLGVSDPELYTLLGATYYKLNDFPHAEEHLRHAIALSAVTTGAAHLQLYNVYMKSERLPMALAQLETYLKQFPDAPEHAAMEQQAERLRQILKQ